ncbi:ZIP family metal transporter [Halobacteriales archaeon QS_8_69_26]|nr:MAG: ZIP family metal transporter [Halobacteriales archaeon QS_8_69_26]
MKSLRGVSPLGIGAVLVLVVLTGLALGPAADRPGIGKLVGISWVAFVAMAGAAPLGARAAADQRARTLVWGYGLASGAMITSAAVFLVPSAIDHHPAYGGFGVASGILVGFGAHVVGHRITHAEAFDHTALELSAHALSAGVIIGVVYGNLPELGPLLGLSIVSHKGPAGYAAARRLAAADRPVSVLLVPASGVGITGLLSAMVALPTDPVINGVVFGFAAGVFLHVGMDFLPECETGGEIHRAASVGADDHGLLDRLRLHAVAATLIGGLAVFLAWLVLV